VAPDNRPWAASEVPTIELPLFLRVVTEWYGFMASTENNGGWDVVRGDGAVIAAMGGGPLDAVVARLVMAVTTLLPADCRRFPLDELCTRGAAK
jgi:hypothetical protein